MYVLNGLPKFKLQIFINHNVINRRWQRSHTNQQKNCVKKMREIYKHFYIYWEQRILIYMFQDFANNED